MKPVLDITTVTKDDLDGIAATVLSTKRLRACHGFNQIIIDISTEPVAEKIKELLVNETNIEYFWQDPIEIAAAFNFGIDASNAEWSWFPNGRYGVHPDLD